MRSLRGALISIAVGVGLALFGTLGGPPPALASTNQRAIFEDDLFVGLAADRTLKTLRQLGVGTVRVVLHWSDLAAAGFAPFDHILRAAQANGIEVDVVLAGPAPPSATAPGIPDRRQNYGQWKPSVGAYGRFVQSAGAHYDGRHGAPRVHFWEIWNEENWGQDLAPQAGYGSTVSVSPRFYRPMLDAGWSALQATGHSGDTILIGSLSPRGENRPGPFHTTKPLKFLRGLYCVGSNYRRLRGGAAARIGCPPSGRGFRSAHPALFRASGLAVHPYPYFLPPTQSDSGDPDYTEFSQLPRVEATVSRLKHAYGSSGSLPLYNTEYAYETDPPNNTVVFGHHFISPERAAWYINWAEYLSWKRPWLLSYMQYLLYDPPAIQGASIFGTGGFAAGLVFARDNLKKADYSAYRMPIFLPRASTRRGRPLEVWACVRPAHFAQADTGLPQFAQIQLNGRTVQTVAIRDPHGYFDVPVRFPSSGLVRIRWSYPAGDSSFANGYTDPLAQGATIYSRTVPITVR